MKKFNESWWLDFMYDYLEALEDKRLQWWYTASVLLQLVTLERFRIRTKQQLKLTLAAAALTLLRALALVGVHKYEQQKRYEKTLLEDRDSLLDRNDELFWKVGHLEEVQDHLNAQLDSAIERRDHALQELGGYQRKVRALESANSHLRHLGSRYIGNGTVTKVEGKTTTSTGETSGGEHD